MLQLIKSLPDRIALLYWVIRIYRYLNTCIQDNNAHDAGSIYLNTGISDLMMYDALSFMVRHYLVLGPDPRGDIAQLPAYHHLWWYHQNTIKDAFWRHFPPKCEV